jgi:hypothetical protein
MSSHTCIASQSSSLKTCGPRATHPSAADLLVTRAAASYRTSSAQRTSPEVRHQLVEAEQVTGVHLGRHRSQRGLDCRLNAQEARLWVRPPFIQWRSSGGAALPAAGQGFVPLPGMVGYGATVWDLLPTYPSRIMEHGALGGPTYPPRITEHGAPGVPTYPSRITEHGAGNQRNYSGNQAK